jgi:hypothetical protein
MFVVLLYQAGINSGEFEESTTDDLIETQFSTGVQEPIGRSGLIATYRYESNGLIPGSVVRTFTLALGPLEEKNGTLFQWLHLQTIKSNGEQFNVWILTDRYPPANLSVARETTLRYILQEGNNKPLEFRHQFTGEAVLPSLGAWKHLFPRAIDNASSNSLFAGRIKYLGNIYLLEKLEDSKEMTQPVGIKILELLPDVLIGVPHNTKQKDETRRYDDSDYELIRLTQNDYDEMIDSEIFSQSKVSRKSNRFTS